MMWKIIRYLLLCGTLLGCGDVNISAVPQNSGYLGIDLGRVAIVTSDFEQIEEVFSQFSIQFDLYDGFVSGPPSDAALSTSYTDLPSIETLLDDAALLSTYNLLVLNCGIRGSGVLDPETLESQSEIIKSSVRIQNVQSFVENGGKLFVSDWSYSILEQAFPSFIDFRGDDLELGAAEVGVISDISAQVTNTGLEEFLAATDVQLEFEVSGWAVPKDATGIYLQGDILVTSIDGTWISVYDAPLLVQQYFGYGILTYSSFHNPVIIDEVFTNLQVFVLRSLGDPS